SHPNIPLPFNFTLSDESSRPTSLPRVMTFKPVESDSRGITAACMTPKGYKRAVYPRGNLLFLQPPSYT
ncbi:MAG: hypothetical protein Q9187_007682, partial [Circinaria calcarea]